MGKVYVVFVGITPGIYDRWEVCRAQVEGFPNAVYCKFQDENDALAAFRKFTFERNWFSQQNPINKCPKCEQILNCEISNVKGTCGERNLVCENINCGYTTPMARLIPIHTKQHNIVEDEANAPRRDPEHEALKFELEASKEKLKDYENLFGSFQKIMKLKDDATGSCC